MHLENDHELTTEKIMLHASLFFHNLMCSRQQHIPLTQNGKLHFFSFNTKQH